MSAGRDLWCATLSREPYEWETISETARKVWENRAAGNMDFVPSEPGRLNAEHLITVVPKPEPASPARLVELDDPVVPGGAKTLARKAVKNGWIVIVSHCQGPWPTQSKTTETDDGEEVSKWQQADTVLVRGYRRIDGQLQQFARSWVRKPWTKVGQKPPTTQGAGGYEGEVSQVRPRPEGLETGIVGSDPLKLLIESVAPWRTA